MAQPPKAITLARLNDAILGAFAHVQPSETLDHLVRYLGTWSGSDKLFMVIQYAVKLIVPLLQLRARVQHRAGLRQTPNSRSAEAYAKLGDLIADGRTLWRIWGLLPIFQWLISLERSPPSTRNLLTIERLQGWSMLAYYPLEHLWYLLSHEIIPSTVTSPLSLFSSKIKKVKLDADRVGMWSCRFWALYVVLHFAHLVEDRKILQQRQLMMKKAKGTGLTQTEKQELKQRWDAFWSEVVINVGYLPLTIHWSLGQGLFQNEAWLGVFGLIAAVASFRTGWKATALPPPPPTVLEAPVEPEKQATGYDVSTNQSP